VQEIEGIVDDWKAKYEKEKRARRKAEAKVRQLAKGIRLLNTCLGDVDEFEDIFVGDEFTEGEDKF